MTCRLSINPSQSTKTHSGILTLLKCDCTNLLCFTPITSLPSRNCYNVASGMSQDFRPKTAKRKQLRLRKKTRTSITNSCDSCGRLSKIHESLKISNKSQFCKFFFKRFILPFFKSHESTDQKTRFFSKLRRLAINPSGTATKRSRAAPSGKAQLKPLGG